MMRSRYIYNLLSLTLLTYTFFAHAHQTYIATPEITRKKVRSLQDIALGPVFQKIVAYINNLPGKPLPTQPIVKQALDYFNIPPNLRAPIIYALIFTIQNNPAISREDVRTVLMSLLPFMVRTDETNPKTIPDYVKQLVLSMGNLPYHADIVPWLMNLLEQASAFTSDREAFTREVLYALIFERNAWSRENKRAFIDNVFTFIREQQKELKGAMQLSTLQGNRKKRRKILSEMYQDHKKDVLGYSLIVPLSKFYRFITSDISGNNAFNAYTKISHTQRRFTYPLFAAVAVGDPIAVKVILGTGFDINTLDSTRNSALNEAVNRGAYALAILLLTHSMPAHLEHSIIDAHTQDWTIVFNVLNTAVAKSDATMVALLLVLAQNQLDVVMLERAQEIAEQNDLALITHLLDQAIEDDLSPAYKQLAQLPKELVEMLPTQIQKDIKDAQ